MPIHSTSSPPKPVLFVLFAGLLVGTLDIATALVDFYLTAHKNPMIILKYIASGVFGPDAFTGGSTMIIWGFVFHFVIAYSFTIAFYFLYRRVLFIRRWPVVAAILFAICMWAITTRIVIPLSNIRQPAPFHLFKALKAISILVVMIALPLTLLMRRYYGSPVPAGDHAIKP